MLRRSKALLKFPNYHQFNTGFELSKNKWGLTSAYSLSLHTGDSVSLATAGLKLTPRVFQGILFRGLSKQLGVQPQPPAIQTLVQQLTFKIHVFHMKPKKLKSSNSVRSPLNNPEIPMNIQLGRQTLRYME
jgi:hypothetical protein